MQKRLVPLLFPILLVSLVGLIYLQESGNRTLRAAERAFQQGDPGQAATLLASLAPQRPTLWEQAGIYALQAGDPLTAQQYLQQAQTAGVLTGAGYLILGDLYLEQDAPPTALATWEEALVQGAPALDVYHRLFAAHRAANNIPSAIETLRHILALTPQDAQATYQMGLLLTTRDPATALTYLLQAAELDETLSEKVRLLQNSYRPSEETDDPAYTFVNVGQALAALGEWALAREAFVQAVETNPDYAEAWAFLGEAKSQLGEDGLVELDTALNLNPGSLTANMLYALYQKRQGHFELALIYLHAADTLDPGNPAIQVELGSTLNEMGNFNQALAYFQKATALAPREALYWHLLAQFSFQNNTLIEEVGLAAAREALLLDDQDPVALDLMGFGYYLLNEMSTAQRFLLQAVALTPDDPHPWYHLGLVSLWLGDTQQAYDHLTRAVSLAPSSSIAEQAQRVLMRYFP
ncbi:MAG: tetratricopeptide repeat protein [Anaerolineales bacterium]|nr:tetratricopeptide repeat protein [Anaerolineales bacterium]